MKARCLGCGKKVGANGLTKHFTWSRKCEAAYYGAEINESVAPLAPTPIEEVLYERELRAFVFNDISELYYFRYLGPAMIAVLRIMIDKWIAFMIGLVAPEIDNIVGDKLVAAQVVLLLRRRLNPFKGLETEALVEAYAAKHRTTPKYHEFEPLNALGAKRGDHKLGGHYGSIGNLPAEVRYQHEHMILLGIGEDKHLSKFNPTRIFSGASPDTGEDIPELNKVFFAQYRALRANPPIIRVRTLESNPRLGGTAHAPLTRPNAPLRIACVAGAHRRRSGQVG